MATAAKMAGSKPGEDGRLALPSGFEIVPSDHARAGAPPPDGREAPPAGSVQAWRREPVAAVLFLAPAVDYPGEREEFQAALSAFRALADEPHLRNADFFLLLDRAGAGQASPRRMSALFGSRHRASDDGGDGDGFDGDGDGAAADVFARGMAADEIAEHVASTFVAPVSAALPSHCKVHHFFVSVGGRLSPTLHELARVSATSRRSDAQPARAAAAL